ncbi:MAG TPA: CusA/CzcA family heavy metal efflux RND transporter [Candidatus Binataceae bacterium]|nr:CusA/CzcA family heavy metal efflux RND transporter [Candidatus Binataceae bacterium]
MIPAIMELALRQRVVVVGLAVALLVAGMFSFHRLDIEAYPDPVQPLVEVLTLPSGLSAEEVERIVTVPIEYAVSTSRGLVRMDSISLFGLSDIRCYFDWDSDYYWDREEVINNLSFVTLPAGITPGISPENPIGEIYRYTVESPQHDMIAEKTINDWVVARQLQTVPGVIGVSTFGGLTKEYHVDVDPQLLQHYGISLSTLTSAIANSNTNAGGNYLTVGEQAFDVRGIGLIHSLSDIRDIVLSANKGTPISVRNVADVSVGYAPRLGAVGMNGRDEVTEGIVLMRKYGKTLPTLRGVERKVAELNRNGLLPPNYRIVPYYDRTSLVDTTLRTVLENLTVGMVLVFLVLVFFLGNVRAALIAAVNIPLALCGAFILMRYNGTAANLISLGAIDFGIIIDSTVIVVENIHRHLTATDTPRDGLGVQRGAQEVGGAIFFSTLIFVIAFLPLFTMRGVEGAIFSPMSHTYAYALGTAIVLAITLSPVLASYLLAGGDREGRNFIWLGLRRFYHGIFVRALSWPRLTLTIILLLAAAGFSLFPRLGGEFLPKLEEGNIWARATMPLTISLDHGALLANRMRAVFSSFPEVTNVVSQLGRPDDGTETTGFFNIEFSVDLKPQEQWPRGLSKVQLVSQMDARLRRAFPGVSFGYSQNIEDNVDEAMSGVKGTNSVKVFGPDLAADERVANQVMRVMGRVRGITDLAVYRSLGQPNVLITPDREVCERYGLNVGDVNAVIQAAIGGQSVTQVLQGDRSFNLVVRWKPQYRTNLDAIRQIRVSLPSGGYVPLAQVADIRVAEGASFIYREGLERYVPLRFAVRGRDFQSAVQDARRQVEREVKMPREVSLQWAGEWQELHQANERLKIVVPIALLLIAGVLYGATLSLVDTVVIMAQVPIACLGGIVALYLTGVPFSVSAAVGFISIFGIAVMDGILLSFYIRQLWEEGHSFKEAIVMGSDRRFRAIIMTALVDAIGLLPAALSTRIGAQTQRPLAIVVIGGALAIILVTRIFQPVLIYLLHRRLRLADQRGPVVAI